MTGKRQRTRGIIRAAVVVIVALVAVSALAVGLLNRQKGQIMGSWTRSIDYTEQARTAAKEWLNTALMSEEINVEDYIPECRVDIVLVFSEDGSYAEELDRESYDSCRDAAYSGLEEAFKALAQKRIEAAGKKAEDINALISETLGMTLDEYMKDYGPELLPDYDELNGEIRCSGKYKVKGSLLYRSLDENTEAAEGKASTYLCNTDTLVLADDGESPILYSAKEDK